MKINPNTSIVDLSYNLSGSLAGIPAVLEQLPATSRVGFDNLPRLDQDAPFGQTWTPTLSGRNLELSVPVYNELAVQKAPFSTDLLGVNDVNQEQSVFVMAMLKNAVPLTELEEGTSLNNKRLFFLNTNSKRLPTVNDIYSGTAIKMVVETPSAGTSVFSMLTMNVNSSGCRMLLRRDQSTSFECFNPATVPTNDVLTGSYGWSLRTLGLRYDTDLFFRRVEVSMTPRAGVSIDDLFNVSDIWVGDI